MRRAFAAVALLASLVGLAPHPAAAGAATDAALALGAFAVFNQLFGPVFWPGYWGGRVVVPPPYYGPYYYPPPYYYYGPPEVYVAPPPPAATPAPALVQREVVFAHGRYILRGDGVTEAYQWIWVPNPPPPASAPPPPKP
jgi:hypothetical protein